MRVVTTILLISSGLRLMGLFFKRYNNTHPIPETTIMINGITIVNISFNEVKSVEFEPKAKKQSTDKN
jgi:uncharacterized GH25 family protein